ncbi:MAG: MBL fold metallo-hydrolase [Clostridia bacterium]|nr:MBL fold metallo-hydrolase [Clostridia bacterium]
MEMVFCPLYSGSSGNALFAQYGDTRVLIDAGKSGKQIKEALDSIGVDITSLSAILITHEHSDHIAGLGVLARRYRVPIYATAGTWRGIGSKVGAIPPELKATIERGSDFYLGQLGVQPFAIPHDACEPCGFRLWGGQVSLATCTDLGYFPESVRSAITGCDLVLLESNHDPDMLMANPHYSAALKRRILGNKGHLCNDVSADALMTLAASGTRHFILGHLSGENNTPSLALDTAVRRAARDGAQNGRDLQIDLAWRDRVGEVYVLRRDGNAFLRSL